MFLRNKFLHCLFFFFVIGSEANAQSSTSNAWLFLNHEQELSKKWSLLSDIQFRSADHFNYLETVLVRPSLSYKMNEQHSVAVGYAWLGNWMREDKEETFDHEHRLWEQYNLKTKAGKTEITNRLRLEQRFLQQEEQYDFAQRLRYYIRVQMPLAKAKEFKKGSYLALQNEVFVNIQNKEKVNNKFFDQNRAYAAFGYRFGEALELEAGYLFRYQVEDQKMRNHIMQLMITTKF